MKLQKKDVFSFNKKKRKRLKSVYVDENGKLFWKEGSKVNREKVKSYSRIKCGNRSLELGEEEERRI